MSGSLTLASQSIGFISFFFTLLTWLGVYLSLINAMRTAPRGIPIALGNLRQEILMERSLIRHRIKQGDRFHCFPGREMRKVGKSESHIKLMEQTIKSAWRDFRKLEKAFIVPHLGGGDPEEVRSDDAASEYSENEKRNSWQNEKANVAARVRDPRSMRRRQSHIKDRMGMNEAGLSVDGRTYYSTGLRARFLWWRRQDDVKNLQFRVSGLQIRRIEADVFEVDALTRRALQMLGGISGEDPYYGIDNPRPGPDSGGGGTGVRRRRSRKTKSRTGSMASGRRSRDHDSLQPGMREVYEREIRRTRQSSRSRSSQSPSISPSPSRPAKVAGSTLSRGAARQSRSRAPSVVEYEIVNPGRVWVDVDDGRSNMDARRSSIVDRGGRPPPVASRQSYVRDRNRSQPRGD